MAKSPDTIAHRQLRSCTAYTRKLIYKSSVDFSLIVLSNAQGCFSVASADSKILIFLSLFQYFRLVANRVGTSHDFPYVKIKLKIKGFFNRKWHGELGYSYDYRTDGMKQVFNTVNAREKSFTSAANELGKL